MRQRLPDSVRNHLKEALKEIRIKQAYAARHGLPGSFKFYDQMGEDLVEFITLWDESQREGK